MNGGILQDLQSDKIPTMNGTRYVMAEFDIDVGDMNSMFDPGTSKQVILDNYLGKKGTFIASLNDERCFHTELFWELYESITAIVERRVYSDELAAQISSVYQRMLKEMIWHFSPTDSSVIANMPENYDDYIERMDSAVEAYMRRTELPDEEVFEMAAPVKEPGKCKGSRDYMSLLNAVG